MAVSFSAQPSQDSWGEFVHAVEQHTPDRGSIFIEYGSDASDAILLIGSDLTSGAWYKIAYYPSQPEDLRFSKTVGRDLFGVGFRGPVRDGEVPVWDVVDAALSNAAVDEFVPTVAVRSLPGLESALSSVEVSSGDWKVRFRLGNGMRNYVDGWLPATSVQFHDVEYSVSSDGRLLAIRNTTRGDSIEYGEASEVRDGIQVIPRTKSGWRMRDCRTVLNGDPSRFSRIAVGKLAGELRGRVGAVGTLYQIERGDVRTGRGTGRAADDLKTQVSGRTVRVVDEPPKSEWSVSFVIAGGIICLIGGWYKVQSRRVRP